MTEEKELLEEKELPEEKGLKKKYLLWLIIILLLVLVGIAAGIFYRVLQNDDKGRLVRDEMALGGMLSGKSEQEVSELLNAKIEEGMVDIGIAAEPVFEQNGKKGRLGIENIAANHYYFQVMLKLDETGEVLYESGLIAPGYYMEYVELNQRLKAGDYPATAVVSTYSLDESEDKIAETHIKIILYVMDGVFY